VCVSARPDVTAFSHTCAIGGSTENASLVQSHWTSVSTPPMPPSARTRPSDHPHNAMDRDFKALTSAEALGGGDAFKDLVLVAPQLKSHGKLLHDILRAAHASASIAKPPTEGGREIPYLQAIHQAPGNFLPEILVVTAA
jgi:hypothetical protein